MIATMKQFKKCKICATLVFVVLEIYIKSPIYHGYNTNYLNLDADSYFEDVKELKYPVKVQPNLYRLINASNPRVPLTLNTPYLLENNRLCSSVKNLSVLVVVNSATDHFERRLSIRSTWTNDSYNSHEATVRVVFLIGKTLNHVVQYAIDKEFEEYKDLVQGDFIDAYSNPTHKSVMGLKWVFERCRNAKIIMKVDDDTVVNMFLYFHRLKHSKAVQMTNVYCEFDKWFVDHSHFKGVEQYLKYCKGMFVSMTNDIIPSLYLSATKTPFFYVDDVLLFGYAMHKISGLKYLTLRNEEWHKNTNEVKQCFETKREKCSYLVMQASYKEDVLDIWSAIVKHFQERKNDRNQYISE